MRRNSNSQSPPEAARIRRFTVRISLQAGAPSIWCALDNWGGAVHLGGDLDYALAQARAALQATDVVGVGLTPEGIDNNPSYFTMVLDAVWSDPAPAAARDVGARVSSWTASDFLRRWGAARCGRDVPEAARAYELLHASVYVPGQDYLFCCAKPVFCPTTYPSTARPPARPTYNTSALREAWASTLLKHLLLTPFSPRLAPRNRLHLSSHRRR